jgi:putative transposase
MGLYARFHGSNITGLEVVGFLRHLLQHLRGPVVLLWDGGPIHRHRCVGVFIRRHPRLRVYRFPAYAPELNPDEFVWTQAKRALSNSAPRSLRELNGNVYRTIRNIRTSQALLRSCLHASELPWPR